MPMIIIIIIRKKNNIPVSLYRRIIRRVEYKKKKGKKTYKRVWIIAR